MNGHRTRMHGVSPNEELKRFLNKPGVLVLFTNDQTVDRWASFAAILSSRGRNMSPKDIWIAALSVQHGLHLYSRDTHFDEVPQMMRV